MTDVLISNIHLSFIWFQPVLDHWRKHTPLQASMSFLADIDQFKHKFASTHATQEDLMPPWIRGEGQHFWRYYLEKEKHWEANENTIGNHLVPLRTKPNYQISAQGLKRALIPEVYYFPFGIGFVLSAIHQSASGLTFPQAVALLQALRRDNILTVNWGAGGQDAAVKLEVLGQKAVGLLVEQILGAGAAASLKTVLPFSLLTVLQGKYDPPQPVEANGEIHRCLDAVTEWSATWDSNALPALTEVTLRNPNWPPSHLIYSRKHGQAIWFPELFGEKHNHKKYLSCYHRNQLFNALLVKSLGGLLVETAQMLLAHQAPPQEELLCSDLAAELIGRMYGGAGTYRTLCARKHIDQNGWVEDIDHVRQYHNRTPLK